MSLKLPGIHLVLGALADPVRLRLVALCAPGELTVKELTAVIGV